MGTVGVVEFVTLSKIENKGCNFIRMYMRALRRQDATTN